MFFMRAEWSIDGSDLNEETLQEQFGAIAREFHLALEAGLSVQRPRIAIFVSRYQRCLFDLLHLYEIATDR